MSSWTSWIVGLGLLAVACNHSVSNDVLGSGAAETGAVTGPASGSTGGDSTMGGGESESGNGADTGDIKYDVGGGDGGGGEPPPLPFPETCEEAANTKTSVGCTFYPLRLFGVGNVAFVASNVSAQTATVTFSDKTGVIDQQSVSPGQLHSFYFGLEPHVAATAIEDKGYVIESDQPLQVYTMLGAWAHSSTNDASIILPEQALGTKHRVITYNDKYSGSSVPSHYVVVSATEDDTEVTFSLAQPHSKSEAGNGIPALDKDNGPDTLTVTLDRLQRLQIVGWNRDPNTMTFTNDFTGSLVESDKPVSVYSGNACSFAPACGIDCCCCDIIATAVPPTTTYGTEYAGVKLLPLGNEVDIWRFIGNSPGTEVTLTGGVDMVVTLEPGELFDLETAQTFWASSNLPVGLVHFMTSGTSTGFWPPDPQFDSYDCEPMWAPGDPAISWVYPYGNWLHRYLFPAGLAVNDYWCNDHVTVTAPLGDWDSVTLNGAMLPAPTPLADSPLGFAYIPVPDGDYELVAPEGVGVEVSVYGYWHHGSYFYPGGMGLQDLNPAG